LVRLHSLFVCSRNKFLAPFFSQILSHSVMRECLSVYLLDSLSGTLLKFESYNILRRLPVLIGLHARINDEHSKPICGANCVCIVVTNGISGTI
jgi:hypothetical protein